MKSYSAYKGRATVKVLVGITPSGEFCFLSKTYGVSASDKAILELESKIDAVMADKGFFIEAECVKKLIRPPFLQKKLRFNENDRSTIKSIAGTRIHVQRTIQRITVFKIMIVPIPCGCGSAGEFISTNKVIKVSESMVIYRDRQNSLSKWETFLLLFSQKILFSIKVRALP